MINEELRSKGIGASEVAAILGMDPRRDAFAVWARKLKLVEEPEPNIRMRRGKYFERGIVDWYADETAQAIQWSDTTVQNRFRPWQVATPDAYVVIDQSKQEGGGLGMAAIGGVDAKLVSWDQRGHWGDPGTSKVPDHYAIQNQWTCSTLDYPWWDIAAALGDELRVYRIHRDVAIESILLETIEKFWTVNILGRVEPPIGATETAAAYIKQRFPKNVEPLRVATPEEVDLLNQYKAVRDEWDAMEKKYTPIENQVKLAIGDADGILAGAMKVTYKRSKDTMGVNWKGMATDLAGIFEALRRGALTVDEFSELSIPATMAEFEKKYECVTKEGSRRLLFSAK